MSTRFYFQPNLDLRHHSSIDLFKAGFKAAFLDTTSGQLLDTRVFESFKIYSNPTFMPPKSLSTASASMCEWRGSMIPGFEKNQRFYTADEMAWHLYLNAPEDTQTAFKLPNGEFMPITKSVSLEQ